MSRAMIETTTSSSTMVNPRGLFIDRLSFMSSAPALGVSRDLCLTVRDMVEGVGNAGRVSPRSWSPIPRGYTALKMVHHESSGIELDLTATVAKVCLWRASQWVDPGAMPSDLGIWWRHGPDLGSSHQERLSLQEIRDQEDRETFKIILISSPLRMSSPDSPILLGTWSFSLAAIEAAWPSLVDPAGGLLDALQTACRHADRDPNVDSVGFGGLPDASGRMSLDGAIMLSPSRLGGVCGVRRHLHPVDIARFVMDSTEHTLLCGEDADDFADRHGLPSSDLLAPEAREAWEAWHGRGAGEIIDQSQDAALLGLRPVDPGLDTEAGGRLFRPGDGGAAKEGPAPAGHDTIGVLARDAGGTLGAACSTSGLPFKVPGRVGDSPIPGHGFFVEPGVGQATATGTGELISGISASMVAVETLRRGGSLNDAVLETLKRVEDLGDLRPHHQVGIIVMDHQGRYATGGFRPGFLIAVRDAEGGRLLQPDLVLRPQDDGPPESATDGFAKSVPSPSD